MIKPPISLGNNWGEVFGSALLLLLFSPIILAGIIIFMPLIGLMAFLSWARQEPKPPIPKVLGETDMLEQDVVEAYVAKAKELVEDLELTHDKAHSAYILSTPMLGRRKVSFEYAHGFVTMSVDDLNCYSWNTSESTDLDPFFWAAIAALTNGVYPARTKLGRRVYWIKSDELGIWLKIQRTGAMYDSMDAYSDPPESVLERYRRAHKAV